MMEAVRSLGLAARFVTGYLHVPEGRRGERTGFRTRNRGLQIELTRYSNPSSELRASRRALFLSKCFERVTDKIMATRGAKCPYAPPSGDGSGSRRPSLRSEPTNIFYPTPYARDSACLRIDLEIARQIVGHSLQLDCGGKHQIYRSI